MTAFAAVIIAFGWGRAFLRQVPRLSQNNNTSTMVGIYLKDLSPCRVSSASPLLRRHLYALVCAYRVQQQRGNQLLPNTCRYTPGKAGARQRLS